jgi:hypothetical protein
MILYFNYLQKIILFLGLLSILIMYSFNKILQVEYLHSVCFCFLIHLFALVISIDLFKYLKIPFTFYFSLLSLVTYGLSPFFVDKFDFQLGQLDFSIYGILNSGFLLFYLVYFILIYSKIRNNNTKQKNKCVSKYSVINLKYIFLIIYILCQFVKIPISSFNDYIEYFLCGLFFICFLKDYNNKYENFILLIFISYVSLKLLLTGFIYTIIYFSFYLGSLFIIYLNFTFKKYVPLFIYLFFILIFSIVFSSVKMKYRDSNNYSLSLYEKSIILKELLNDDLAYSNNSTEQKIKDGPIWRLSYPLSAFSQVTVMTPNIVPYWDGETYKIILYKFIPRFIFPNKPEEDVGQLFGHRYSFLSDDNLTTSMNSPILAEAFMNFGNLGFFTIIVLMAVLFSNFFFFLNLKNLENNELFNFISSIHLALLSVYFIQWESNLSMLLGKCLILFIFDKLIKKIIFTYN